MVDGRSSHLMKQLCTCNTCAVRDICDYRTLLDENQQNQGCGDKRRILLANIGRWQKPATVLASRAAEIKTMMDLQSLQDGYDKVIGSKSWKELVRLELEVSKEIRHWKENLDDSPRHRIEVTFNPLKKEKVIELNPDSYDSDTIPEMRELHGNVRDEDAYRERKSKELEKELDNENIVADSAEGISEGRNPD